MNGGLAEAPNNKNWNSNQCLLVRWSKIQDPSMAYNLLWLLGKAGYPNLNFLIGSLSYTIQIAWKAQLENTLFEIRAFVFPIEHNICVYIAMYYLCKCFSHFLLTIVTHWKSNQSLTNLPMLCQWSIFADGTERSNLTFLKGIQANQVYGGTL